MATDHYKVVFNAHKSLCDALVDGTRRWGAKVIMMPIVPRTNLRYDMTPINTLCLCDDSMPNSTAEVGVDLTSKSPTKWRGSMPSGRMEVPSAMAFT